MAWTTSGPRRARPWVAALLATAVLTKGATDEAGSARADPSPATSASARGAEASVVRQAASKAERAVAAAGGSLGLHALDLETGVVLASVDAETARNPASNAKLATAVAALERLGPQHRFVTGLYGTIDASGKIAKLVMRGRGDPTLRDADLADMARELQILGARRVDAIEVDQGAFERWTPPAFEQQPGEWAPFRANVAPLSVDENVITFWVRPEAAGGAAVVVVDPPGAAAVEGSIETGKPGSPETVRVDLRVEKGRLLARVGGAIPAGAAPMPVARRADDPRKLAGLAMREALRGAGMSVGDAVDLGGASSTHALVVRSSRPLGEILPMLGKESDNFAAEMLLLALSPASAPATPEAGAAVVREILAARGALDPGMKVANGSGLFDANRSTPRALTRLLASAWDDPRIGPELAAHLSIAGVDGTLRGRLRQWADERAIRAKSGTLAATVALSGYVVRPGGRRPVVFSAIASDCRGKTREAREAIDAFVDALARSAYGR